MKFTAWIPAFAGMTALALSSCISIGTYEAQMKKCRAIGTEAEDLKVRLASLEENNRALVDKLSEKEELQAALQSEMSEVRNTYDELVQELKDTIADGDVGIKETADGLTITVGDKILFQSGKSELQPKGKKVLGKVAGVLRKTKDRLIRVEGHTDNVPISSSLKGQFPSNWELSAARSASVVRFLQESGKIDPSLLVLTAFGETHPIQPNTTPQGRQQNRRVEITLIPKPQ